MATDSDVDVVVLGAGVAGLAAAGKLARAGKSVALLEARERTGGRVDTRRERGWPRPLELGAEFIQGKSRTLFRLARKAGLKHVSGEGEYLFFEDGHEAADAEKRFAAAVEAVAQAKGELSVREHLEAQARLGKLDRKALALALHYVEGYYAAEASKASAQFIGDQERASREMDGLEGRRFLHGYDGIVAHLEERFRKAGGELHLRFRVREVRWKKGFVEVRGEGLGGVPRVLTARACIVTLPVGVLKGRDVRFSPRLSEHENALDKLEGGQLFKLLARFSSPFWEDGVPSLKRRRAKKLGFINQPDAPFPTVWTYLPERLPMMAFWCGGPRADGLLGKSEDALAADVGTTLAGAFGMKSSEVLGQLTGIRFHDWVLDPFTRGGYMFADAAGGSEAITQLARDVEKTVFFAGEATHSAHQQGTVHGAVETGERAAEALLSRASTQRG